MERLKRRLAYLNFKFNPLDKIDILILTLFFILFIAAKILKYHLPLWHFGILLSVGMFSWMCIYTSTLGLRFSNFYFSLGWLVLSIGILEYRISVSYLPLVSFVTYSIFRLIFWRKKGREFIPFNRDRSGYSRFFSKTHGRVGGPADKRHMVWLFRTGWIVLIITFSMMVGFRI